MRRAVVITALLLSWLLPAASQGFNFMGPGGGFRPQPDSNARGVPPAPAGNTTFFSTTAPDGTRQITIQRNWHYGGGPQPFYGQPRQGMPSVDNSPPRVVTRVDTRHAFVYQNLLLTLEVISNSNLETLDIDLPQDDAVVFRQIGKTDAQARMRGGRREIVTRQQYLLIPVRPGALRLDPIHVSGTRAGPGARHFEATAATGLELNIDPPKPGIRPWLPLQHLELGASLANEEQLLDGKPATLILKQSAIGATGAQLPSLERQLKSDRYRLYREKTETTGVIDKRGQLVGQRIDHFTLVPRKAGRLELPSVSVRWWNLTAERAETTILPVRLLGVTQGNQGAQGESGGFSLFPSGASWVFWLPLVVIAFFTGVYWTYLWARSRTVSSRVGRYLGLLFAPLARRLGWVGSRLAPQRYLHLLRRAFAQALPRPFRLWFCVRAADAERDPEDWSQVLRFLVERRLGIPAQRPLNQLAEQLAAMHPGARADRIRDLLRELDQALFGRGAIADFEQWKRDFKREIRPRPLRLLLPARRRTVSQGLPALNP